MRHLLTFLCVFGAAYAEVLKPIAGGSVPTDSCLFHGGDPTKVSVAKPPHQDWQTSPLQQAYKGFDGNGNIQTSRFGKEYKGGWCGLHVRAYKPDLDWNFNPGKHYSLELTVKDAEQNDVPVQGLLPYIVHATAPKDDEDHVYFNYAGDSWHTRDGKNCKGSCGPYDRDLYMDCDCGFSC
ncbi:hypothetical protein NUU61_004013 [Penicillium alfredii]|uniref:Uncharacterized protein n=1 Tax=Penicillium alfredii TaxID=1506179 RepID=A0A9W9KDE9_9EURO|nr:uncharacterized protein NUU61_004013 [Penicillium alfredii]KAJ5101791.1 hypothetical protein NUU61_004013 [Penicillium alfredii]